MRGRYVTSPTTPLLVLAAAAVVLSLLLALGFPHPAGAIRPAKGHERDVLQRVAVRDCWKTDGFHCRRAPVHVSTVNRRFAFGGATGGHYYGGALMKKRAGGRWRVSAIQGGGAMTCRWWYRFAPRRVIHDLRIEGLKKGQTEFGRC